MRGRKLARRQITQSRMDSFIVVVIDIISYRRSGFGQRVMQIRPDLFFLDRPNHTLDIGIVIGSIVAGILPSTAGKGDEESTCHNLGCISVL